MKPAALKRLSGTTLIIDGEERLGLESVLEEEMNSRTAEEVVEEEYVPTARPRRLSEIHIPKKIKPIPKASSLFLFKHDNRSASTFLRNQ